MTNRWEHTGSELRGHFLGHWLSASAMAFAATRDAELRHRMTEVAEILGCSSTAARAVKQVPPAT